MSLALQSLVALTLLLCAAVATLPDLVQPRRPRLHPQPPFAAHAQPLWVVRSGQGRWFLAGEPLQPAALLDRLRRESPQRPVHLLVSSSLSAAETGASLRWLRRQSKRAVLLQLPPGGR
ncbi:MAG: hypothetical protein VKK62_05580 [Synechococcaceae cyanobacterium]|nr:hypothetical protein [Synechococcaceae cyanobacterium]